MVAYAVTRQPALFKAAIELYGVADRATFLERTNRNSAVRWARKMGGSPEEKPDVYRKANVLPDVPKITAPVLVMHGEDDPQVPPYEASLAGANIRLGPGSVDVRAARGGHRYTTTVRTRLAVRLRLGATLPFGAHVVDVRLDGRPVSYQVRRTNRGLEVVANAGRVGAATSTLTVTTS